MSLTQHRQPLDTRALGRVVSTFNAYHLGDQLFTLHYLRAQAKAHREIHFAHAAPATYLPQLAPLTAGLPNLSLSSLALLPSYHLHAPLNTWLGAAGWFYGQPDRHDFVAIYLRHFANLSRALDLPSPFTTARDLLFDYSALAPATTAYTGLRGILVVNSAPQSSQFQGFSHDGFDRIIAQLHAAGHTVYTTAPSRTRGALCTLDLGASVTDIGRLSADHITAIIGVPTGPMWPTFNIWNADAIKLRLLLLDTERVDILPESTVHANHLSLVPEILKDRGLL
tara:strand:+ start:521 stop:1366 length:846 start_codon:yes stop_codon:yes gene_type:complete